MTKRASKNTVSSLVIAHQAAETIIPWPSSVQKPLEPEKRKISETVFIALLREKPTDSWTDYQILVCSQMAKVMAALEMENRQLDIEGNLISSFTSKGREILVRNPRLDVVQSLQANLNQGISKIGCVPDATQKRTGASRAKSERAVRETKKRTDDSDGLLA